MSIRGEYVDNLLFMALLDLAEEMPLRKISVKMLTERAGVARQTFYNHFTDINDLISWAPFHYVSARSRQSYDINGIRAAYEFALEHRGFFSQLPRHSGQNNFRESFVMYVSEFSYEQYVTDDMDDETRLRRSLSIRMFAHGIVNLFLDWCEADLTWPLEILLQAQDDVLPTFMREDMREDMHDNMSSATIAREGNEAVGGNIGDTSHD